VNLLLFSRWRPKGDFISKVPGLGSESSDPNLRVHGAVQLSGAIGLDREVKIAVRRRIPIRMADF
jgi:hypothetical protein